MTRTFVTYVLDEAAERERCRDLGILLGNTVSTTIDAGDDVLVSYYATTQVLRLTGSAVDLTVQCVASVSVQRFR